MSIAQKKSIEEEKLRRRAKRAAGKQLGTSNGIVVAMCADGWLDGYKAALKDVRKVSQAIGGADHTAAGAGYAVLNWLEEMP